jgi:hypothetical protein
MCNWKPRELFKVFRLINTVIGDVMVVLYESSIKEEIGNIRNFIREARREGARSFPKKLYHAAKNNPEKTAKVVTAAALLTYGALTINWQDVGEIVTGQRGFSYIMNP